MPLDPTRRDVIRVMEEEALTGARVMAQATPRDFNMSARLKETSMLLMGIKSWDSTMKLPDAERLAAFGDPGRGR